MKEYSLGTWDLSCLAPHHESSAFREKLKEIEEKVDEFEKKKSLLKNDIPSEDFYGIVRLCEELSEEMSKIGHYAHLLFASDTSNPKVRSLLAKVDEFNAKIANKTLFFNLWWKKGIDEQNAQRLLRDAGQLRHYLARQRELARYALSEPEEKIINIKDVTGVGFIRKLYDQYTERFVFQITVDGKKKKFLKPQIVSLFHSPDPDKRRAAYRSLLKVYGANEDVLGEIYRTVVLDWKNEAVDLRGYDSPISVRNVLNDVSDETVETLLNVCRKNRTVFQRYFKAKAKLLGMKKMSRYHIYAPISAEEKEYPFPEAVKLVLNALKGFSPEIAELAEKVLRENHLDSQVRKGKRGGAFCATASPSITPFVLVNYTGKQSDVFTLAHELGHAVHSLLAADKSILVQHAPLPLAELASIFSEMVLTERLYETASREEKVYLIARQLDDMYATIMRQAYFTVFEKDAHKTIAEGATVNEVSDIYYRNLKEQFGTALWLPENFRYEWTYIPHFYHTPFYTYAYSFGNLLTVAVYQKYLKDRTFVNQYIKILSAGGSENPEELLKKADINVKSEQFWQTGFDYIQKRTEELEKL
ncbi:M3 family oligoendopeptidase [Candidatus Bathyarchaeota archaeon]|nr:MAG: M3 family oligoendopeptidase [Candidatus Bathyarchaeota archaeon]